MVERAAQAATQACLDRLGAANAAVASAALAQQPVATLASEEQQAWSRAVAAVKTAEEAARTAARLSRQAAEMFETQAHTMKVQLEFLHTIGPPVTQTGTATEAD